MPVAGGQNATLCKHVDDGRHEKPPVASLVRVIEEAVLDPSLLVLVQSRGVPFGPFVLAGDDPDTYGEEGEDGSEDSQSDAGENFGGPRVAVGELKDAVQDPDAVKEEDEIDDGLGKRVPIPLPEGLQSFWERTEQGPSFQNDLEEKDTDGDGSNHDGEDQKYGPVRCELSYTVAFFCFSRANWDLHEGVGLRYGQLLDVASDAVYDMGDGAARAIVGARVIDARVDGPRKEARVFDKQMQVAGCEVGLVRRPIAEGEGCVLQELHVVVG